MTAITRLRTPPVLIGLAVALFLLMAVAAVIGFSRESRSALAASNSLGRAIRTVEVVSIQPVTIPALGAVQVDAHGDKWIWLGRGWAACQHIDPITLKYNSINTDPAITAWAVLATVDKIKIVEVCR